jgi:hypothetical protein
MLYWLLATCKVAAVVAAVGDLSAGPPISGDPASSGSGSTGTTIANFDDYASVECFAKNGIECHILVRDGPARPYRGDESHSDSMDGMTTLVNPGNIAAKVVVTTDATASFPDVAAFDLRNAIVCYKVTTGLRCKAIKFVSKDVHMDHTITVGPELIVTTTNINQFSIDTFDGRGSPPDWAARRALTCYSLFVHAAIRRTECRTISLSFPPLTNAPAIENGLVAGTLTANMPRILDREDPNNPHPVNYPTLRLLPGKALSTFDFFNAILCYTRPVPVCTQYNQQGQCPSSAWHYQWGTGTCTTLQTDIATGTSLTAGGSASLSSSYLITEVAVDTFQSKSGDPTRALVCYIVATYSGGRYTAENRDLRCNVAQRIGSGLTLLNSERTAAGQASDGVSKDLVLATGGGAGSYIKDTTIATLDSYNAVVCWSGMGSLVPFCAYPTGSCTTGGDGLTLLPGSGMPMCRQLWIGGWGSSTYNSQVYSGIASASAPQNVGSVQSISLGAPIALDSTVTNGVYPSATHLKPHYAVACYSANSDYAPCHLLQTTIATKTWSFNDPVDCINGYGCVRRRGLVQKFRDLLGASLYRESVEERT